MLSESAKTWVDSKRRDLTELMWSRAGIVRRRADMKAALQQLATLHHDVQVSTRSWHTAFLPGRGKFLLPAMFLPCHRAHGQQSGS